MKKHVKLIFLTFLFSAINVCVFAQSKNIKFIVNGNCEMCENRIETALNVNGVEHADWDVSTKICSVTYNSSKIKEDNIHRIIALAGHDTPRYKAEEIKYQELHACCKYKRIYNE